MTAKLPAAAIASDLGSHAAFGVVPPGVMFDYAGGAAHNVMQPSAVVCKIIKT